MKSNLSIIIPILLLVACKTVPKTPLEGTLAGVVYDLDKAPVGEANIKLTSGKTNLSSTTNSQGRFTFSDIQVGTYTLSFSKGMYESNSWDVSVTDFVDAVYLQTASYWQLLDAALDALGRKEWGEAAEYLKRGKTIQERSATALFLQAVLDENKGDYQAAIQGIRDALAIDARSPHLWLYLADLYEHSAADSKLRAEALSKYLELKDDPAASERLAKLE